MPVVNQKTWDNFLARHPDAHLLQTAEWGQLKSEFGWLPVRIIREDAGVQLLIRRLPLGYSIAYLPKARVERSNRGLWGEIDEICRQYRAIFLTYEPDEWTDPVSGPEEPPAEGYLPARMTVQPPRTITISLGPGEEQLLANMKQKTRYNIRLAQRKGVVVSPSGDLDGFNALVQETGERDAFGVHTATYYQRVFELFHPKGMCELLIAELEHVPLAGLMVFRRGERAWYLYGASSNQFRNTMPTYLLQWESIRWAKSWGCVEYDLWGVPDENTDKLETDFSSRKDGLWGVYRFKRGFGGQVRRSSGPWDRVYRPFLYRIFQIWKRWA